ncbi:MAG TPA: carbohydrate ABC transporter permease [Candidatus Eisenbergiella merdavium]|uniref:Carbohydrate ABC transporter permease n=1 Tax=Candidatus Eisenbergiella merdavium TaxID=2838551 RepID=A0A9D2NIL7_9FIRM|nr:carbohydrate ABC transporter permease [Candidatus Eisenbergiella merdavium]
MKKNKIKPTGRRIRKSGGEILFEIVVYAIAALFCIYCLFPFAIILGSSFETESNFATYGFPIIPKDFTLQAYKMVLGDSQIFKAYGVTIFTTAAGTLFSMLLTITMAYPLSLKKIKFRNAITFFVYFTMLFGGGLVPTYLLISKTLDMKNNIFVLILPVAFSAWNMFLMRNFFAGIPHELSESAYVDGANDIQILRKIILPVSVPGIATLSLFYALGYWNQWFNAMLYIEDANLFPLQYLLMRMLRNADAMREMARTTGMSVGDLPTNSLRMATTVVAIGPIVLLYPYVQKYFTSGLTVGAIKG